MIVQKALKEADFGMRQLAESEGLSYGVVRAWGNGRRTPTPENIRKLAEGLRNQAERLTGLASELDATADGE